LSRCGIPDSGVGLTQFFVDGDGYTPRTSTVSLADRPPMNAVAIASPAEPGAAGRHQGPLRPRR
jgi:glucosyl-3-phosphoglycerate synthase